MNSSNIMSSTNLTGIFQTPFIHSTKTSFTQKRVRSKISSCSNQLPECKCLRRNLIGASTFRGLLGIQGGTWLQLSWKLTRGNEKQKTMKNFGNSQKKFWIWFSEKWDQTRIISTSSTKKNARKRQEYALFLFSISEMKNNNNKTSKWACKYKRINQYRSFFRKPR